MFTDTPASAVRAPMACRWVVVMPELGTSGILPQL